MEFKFKQFSVTMTDDVFKVGTDASLLGCLLKTDLPTAKMLEIGTGTGVIALMIAQRYTDSTIDAIDISKEAVDLANSNFNKSPFSGLRAIMSDAKSFIGESKYDVIFTNPPYHLEEVFSNDKMKHRSKSQANLLINDLVTAVNQNLNEEGEFWVVAPPQYISILEGKLLDIDLFVKECIDIQHLSHSKVSRQVVCFSRNKIEPNKKAFVLYKEQRLFSDQATAELSPYLIVL